MQTPIAPSQCHISTEQTSPEGPLTLCANGSCSGAFEDAYSLPLFIHSSRVKLTANETQSTCCLFQHTSAPCITVSSSLATLHPSIHHQNHTRKAATLLHPTKPSPETNLPTISFSKPSHHPPWSDFSPYGFAPIQLDTLSDSLPHPEYQISPA
jgi:hypothetical protein